MADYIVKDTELTSVANAIRTAGGTNSLLSFPNGFVSAVNNISGGGGSSDFSTAEVTVISNVETLVQISYAENNLEDIEGGCASMPSINTEFIEEPLTVILYKGHAWFGVSNGSLSAEGDATIIDDTLADITGDCTITIN